MDSVTNNRHASSIFGERIFVWKICCFDVKNFLSTMCPDASTMRDIQSDHGTMMRLVMFETS